MNQSLTLQEYYNAPTPVIIFVEHWKKQKGHTEPTITIGIAWEILRAVSRSSIVDGSMDPGENGKSHFSYIINHPDILLAWESDNPIEDFWYALNQEIRIKVNARQLAQARITT